MFAVRTMNQFWVRPKIAGIESTANITSVRPMVMNTTTMGVNMRLPSTVVRSLLPSKSSATLRRRVSLPTMPGSASSPSSSSWSWCQAVQSRNTPKM